MIDRCKFIHNLPCEQVSDRIIELEDENAKLRELIRTMWLAGDFRAFLGVEEIKERMRELGIEVNDDA